MEEKATREEMLVNVVINQMKLRTGFRGTWGRMGVPERVNFVDTLRNKFKEVNDSFENQKSTSGAGSKASGKETTSQAGSTKSGGSTNRSGGSKDG